jgi:hypothetical protein
MTFGGIFSMVIHAINLLNNYALDICYQIIKQQRIKELSGVKESLLSYY